MQARSHCAEAATDSLLAHGGTDIAEVAETQRSQSFLVVGFLAWNLSRLRPQCPSGSQTSPPCDLCAFASSAMRVPPFNREPPSQPIDDPANPVLESQFMEIDQRKGERDCPFLSSLSSYMGTDRIDRRLPVPGQQTSEPRGASPGRESCSGQLQPPGSPD